MATVSWIWHRLGAMTPAEMGLRARNRLLKFTDSRRAWDSTRHNLERSGVFPRLPEPEAVPDCVHEALGCDVQDILAGRWKAFGHLDIKVDDPPRWHCDYLVDQDLFTTESSFKLDHRELAGGADVKLIWELSRWHQLVRLAMAFYVRGDETARGKCIEWLEDWVMHNPPYRGWNWTSALEAGMRLIQFTWMDALLNRSPAGPKSGGEQGSYPATALQQRLERLHQVILPPHVWYVWRHKSFGSSANNHLLGELAGCVLATVRWPALAAFAAPLSELQACWEREVLAQFAEDGGNKEQALNYHLFSFELCWQALKALEAAGRPVSIAARQRLALAGQFFADVQVDSESWDYGDSDNAFVTPFFASDAVQEWREWLQEPPTSAALMYWLGETSSFAPPVKVEQGRETASTGEWRAYSETGMAICEPDPWRLRWDVSPLGYLSTAAHGHLDALHLSVWIRGVALVIDPGTGAYYSDQQLRAWLSSRAAHNGPCPEGTEWPARFGPFLWATHHPVPKFQAVGAVGMAELDLGGTLISRRITIIEGGRGFQVEDGCFDKGGRPAPFRVRWQFAPGSSVTVLTERSFSLERSGVNITVEVSDSWSVAALDEGVVSPAFRQTCPAPLLELTAIPGGGRPSLFCTTFVACLDNR